MARTLVYTGNWGNDNLLVSCMVEERSKKGGGGLETSWPRDFPRRMSRIQTKRDQADLRRCSPDGMWLLKGKVVTVVQGVWVVESVMGEGVMKRKKYI